ncbi:MAG: DUF4860 domain-containing protein [Clostridiales bacterium]|nr:DUF4860 domain-containing protein [Clostridiales bacterium]
MRKQNNTGPRTMAALLLCAAFFLPATGLVLLGSGVYRGVAAASDENSIHRTALSYLTNQVRRSDTAGGVSVTVFDGTQALALDDGDYVILLYCYDGELRELYAERTSLADFTAAAGMGVLPLSAFSAAVRDGGLTLTADGHSVTLYPRCGAEEVAAP